MTIRERIRSAAGNPRQGLDPMMLSLLNEHAPASAGMPPMPSPPRSDELSPAARPGDPARRWRCLLLAGLVAGSLGAAPGSVRAQGSVQTDRAALEALYRATGGPNWTMSTNWLTAAPLGNWYGVDTDEDGRVTALRLGYWDDVLEESVGNALTGSIPPEVGNLARLRHLRLHGNRNTDPEAGRADPAQALTGPIPVTLAALANLEFLDLSHNELTGPIPPWLGGMTRLTGLFLQDNALTGSIPDELKNLTNLEWLWLRGDSWTGSEPIPTWLGTLTNLRGLDLGGHNLTGTIPAWLLNLINLEHLSFQRNDLTGPIPTWLGSLTELRWLELWDNELTGSIPSSLASLANLERLQLWDNELTGSIPSSLGTLTNLQHLDLWGNELSGPIPSSLASLANLERLRLNGNALTGSIPAWLGSLTTLTRLTLSGNPLTGPFPSSLTALSLDQFWIDICVPPLYQAWVEAIADFRGTVCGALPHIPGIRVAPRPPGF